jgi:homoserine O-acetyltransferase/O-succinyltransferase
MLRLCAALGVAVLAHVPLLASAHWPGQPEHQMAQLDDLKLESGEVIKNFRMSYVAHGKLNAAKDNAILFQTGFAANHHLFDHMIGPGRPLDTDKYFIICPDPLGATQTTYEHTTSPTNSGLKMKFPFYNERDMVNAQYRLITETLRIPHLLAVTGISLGGRNSVQFAISHPQFMDGIVPVVGGAMGGTQGRFRGPLMRSSIESCKGWDAGNYDENPKQCAINAISVLATYFYTREWWNQYLDTPEAYTQWRNTSGDYYLDVQDARDLYYMILASGRSQVGDTPGFNGDLSKALGSIKARTLLIYNPQDEFYLPRHIDAQVKMIPNARALAIDSPAGHWICCNADPQATRVMGDAIRGFLQELGAQRMTAK